MLRIWRDVRGNVAIVFSMAALSLILLIGGAIDVANLAQIQSNLQAGADAAALSAARFAGTDSTQRKSQADGAYFANVSAISDATAGTLS